MESIIIIMTRKLIGYTKNTSKGNKQKNNHFWIFFFSRFIKFGICALFYNDYGSVGWTLAYMQVEFKSRLFSSIQCIYQTFIVFSSIFSFSPFPGRGFVLLNPIFLSSIFYKLICQFLFGMTWNAMPTIVYNNILTMNCHKKIYSAHFIWLNYKFFKMNEQAKIDVELGHDLKIPCIQDTGSVFHECRCRGC